MFKFHRVFPDYASQEEVYAASATRLVQYVAGASDTHFLARTYFPHSPGVLLTIACCRDAIRNVLNGTTCCLFAYGQTGSGALACHMLLSALCGTYVGGT